MWTICKHDSAPSPWGGIGQALILYFALAVGVFGNLIVGLIAVARKEYCDGRIVLLGMGLWIFTILFIVFFRHGLKNGKGDGKAVPNAGLAASHL